MNNFYYTHHIVLQNLITMELLRSKNKEVQNKKVEAKDASSPKTKNKDVQPQKDCSVLSEDGYPSDVNYDIPDSVGIGLLVVLFAIGFVFFMANKE